MICQCCDENNVTGKKSQYCSECLEYIGDGDLETPLPQTEQQTLQLAFQDDPYKPLMHPNARVQWYKTRHLNRGGD